MLGVPRELVEHKLHVDPKARPIKQTLRPMHEERRRASAIEVKRILDAGFIVPIKCPKWLSNPVLVQKKNGTWWLCIDYTNLNAPRPRTSSSSPGSIRSSTQPQGPSHSASWMHTPGTTRSRWQSKTRKRQPSRHRSGAICTPQ